MVRYYMAFTVPVDQLPAAQKIIDRYFENLGREGPAGMRSQCYANNEDDCSFIHIKSFRKESVANQHFRSPIFRDYVSQLSTMCGTTPSFARLQQQQTFESIY